MDLSFLASPDAWLTLVTLSALEIVLGIDNLVFISIAVGRLPEHQRPIARKIGIAILVAISNEDIAVAISSVLYVGMFIWLVILNTRSRRDVSVDLVISSSGVNATALPDGSYRVNAAFDLRSLPTPRQE